MNDEAEQFHERAGKAIYLQGELLALLGINPDTTRPAKDITERVRNLLSLAASTQTGCPHVVKGAEGTSYCNLAESSVLALRKQLGEERELHTMQLAAISTACVQNTETTKKDRIGRENPYCTVAYLDVCTSVDREMKERERVRVLREALEPIEAFKKNCEGDIGWRGNRRAIVDSLRVGHILAAESALKATEDAT